MMIPIIASRLCTSSVHHRGVHTAWINLCLLGFLLCFEPQIFAQDSPSVKVGLDPEATYFEGNIDHIDAVSGRLTLDIPLLEDHSQRGNLNFTYDLIYSSSSWNFLARGNSQYWSPGKYGIGTVNFVNRNMLVPRTDHYHERDPEYDAYETTLNEGGSGLGPSHPMGRRTSDGALISVDGTGLALWANGAIDKNGVVYNVNGFQDSNGNEMTLSGTLTASTMTDTLGRKWDLNSQVNPTAVGCPTGATTATVWGTPGPNNASRLFIFCYSTIPLRFFTDNLLFTGSLLAMTTAILPDQTQWQFTYDTTYGDLIQVSFPTGGYIQYQWDSSGVGCGADLTRYVTQRTLFDGINTYNWYYHQGTDDNSLIETDPFGNDTVASAYTGFTDGECADLTGTITYYAGSQSNNQVLKTVTNTYQELANPFPEDMGGAVLVDLGLLTNSTTTWGVSNQTQAIQVTYDQGFTFLDSNPYGGSYTDPYGLVVKKTTTDYGTGAAGAPLLTTNTSYVALSSSNTHYLTANLLSLMSSDLTLDGANHKCSETDYYYDAPSQIVASGVTEQHLQPALGYLGNRTSVVHQLFGNACQSATPSETPLTTNYNVYDTGEVQQVTDPNGNHTTYDYGPQYYGAYPTTITNALQQSTTYNYDFSTGLLTSITDPNQKQTGYQYDVMFRPTYITYPDMGQSQISYPSPTLIAKTDLIDAGISRTSYLLFDGLGRRIRESVTNGESVPYDQVDSCYDGDGRVSYTSYEYQGNGVGDPLTCSQPGDHFTYDGVGRLLNTTRNDAPGIQSTIQNDLATFPCVTRTDEQGKQKQTCTDGLGHLTKVIEDPNGSSYLTQYTPDALGNLTAVSQSGQTRGFSYDSFSRLTSARNPESGNTQYWYDGNGNVTSKQDGNGNTINYSPAGSPIDPLNRVTEILYPDGSAVHYYYDQQPSGTLPISAPSPANPIGRLTAEGTTNSSGAWTTAAALSYDPMGRIALDTQWIYGTQKAVSYIYNLMGAVAQVVYPSGTTLSYRPFNAGNRPTQALDTTNSINYVTNAHFAPNGATCSVVLGTVITATSVFNARLQPTHLHATSSGAPAIPCTNPTSTGTVLDLSYNFSPGSDNGNIFGVTNNRVTDRSQTFSYDFLNRLQSAQTTTTNPTYCWGETYVYDQANGPSPYGSLAQVNALQGAYSGCISENLQQTINLSNNQISGYCYDGAGNFSGGSATCLNKSYYYDFENRLTSAGGQTYTYDAEGRRVQKSNGNTYWYDTSGGVLDESGAGGSITSEYIFFNGKRVARRQP